MNKRDVTTCIIDRDAVGYEREVKISGYYVDFLIDKIVIEANGAWVHSFREDKDNLKYKTLSDLGYTVIVLPEKDIISGEAKNLLDRLFKGR